MINVEITKKEILDNVSHTYEEVIWDCGMSSADDAKESIDILHDLLEDIDRNNFRKLFSEGYIYSMVYKTDLTLCEVGKRNIIIFGDDGKIIDTIANNNIKY